MSRDEPGRAPRLLVATAVKAEREALTSGLAVAGAGPERVNVVAVGVGPAAAAASCVVELLTAATADQPYAAVVSAGIAGGFTASPDTSGEAHEVIGSLALGDRFVAADLGAESPEGFVSLDELGFGVATIPADVALTDRLARLLVDDGLAARRGDALTVATVTGTAARATELRTRYPAAVTEGMEGYGIATAAAACGVPALELRAVSNVVGPRDRAAWRIDDALAALATAAPALARLLTVDEG